ncbi:MAG: thiamine pyrophosphate-dependent dehydrogenase E1 component subunit alpha [Bryobacteraceae bacterium]
MSCSTGNGYNRGKGGSMHIADLSIGIYGANGIVAAGAPIAAGAAWASKIRKSGLVAVTFFGDGGANQGVLHETMNMAGIWKLPLLFVCENNQYAVTTPVSYATAGAGISQRAAAYGFPGICVDGMDVEAVMSAAQTAVERARAGEGPTLIECKAYRYQGHFTAERALKLTYRQADEIETWRVLDPILKCTRRLQENGSMDESRKAELDAEIEALLDEAVLFSRASEWPQRDEALQHMYAVNYAGLPARGSTWNAN